MGEEIIRKNRPDLITQIETVVDGVIDHLYASLTINRQEKDMLFNVSCLHYINKSRGLFRTVIKDTLDR